MSGTIVGATKSLLRRSLGVDVVRVRPPGPGARYQKNLLYEADDFFNRLYDEGMSRSGTPDGGLKRRERFYNLVQFFRQVVSLDGAIAECGCWRGLSSYLLCHYLRAHRDGFGGENYHIFDSFEGLSAPTGADRITDQAVTSGTREFGQAVGTYAADQEHVQAVMADFPRITYHKGWIPESLRGLPELRYAFVHVDVDIHEPTRGAIEYFYPRLCPGGMIVCDDYGSLYWPGAKRAIDEYCAQHRLPLLTVSTGQAILWKR
jgi:O-methyltransferase